MCTLHKIQIMAENTIKSQLVRDELYKIPPLPGANASYSSCAEDLRFAVERLPFSQPIITQFSTQLLWDEPFNSTNQESS